MLQGELKIKKVIRNGIENKNSNIVMCLYTNPWKTMHNMGVCVCAHANESHLSRIELTRRKNQPNKDVVGASLTKKAESFRLLYFLNTAISPSLILLGRHSRGLIAQS